VIRAFVRSLLGDMLPNGGNTLREGLLGGNSTLRRRQVLCQLNA
jgi:hypothetical protein